MLKGQKKHINKEQGKTKHEAPRSVNYRATQNKNNIGTTDLERSVVYTTGGLKAFHCTNFTLGLNIGLNTKMHKKFGLHTGFLTPINASQRKHKIKSITVTKNNMSHVTRKLVFGMCDQLGLKQAC